ncbi:MAG: pyridoxamine 5'-phosphate oxidase family protein [Alphaproteobacteria bacterium]
MKSVRKTKRTTLKRRPERAGYDRAAIDAIVDDALICHVGFLHRGQPAVIATACWRENDHIYIHGSSKSRMLVDLVAGSPLCLAVTHFDGLVLARSAFNHSVNYRALVLYGNAQEVTEPAHKLAALKAFMDKTAPGRWDSVRPPNKQELKATKVLRIAIDEASTKIRTGPPKDDEADYSWPVWAGIVPFRFAAETPIADPKLPKALPAPKHTRHWAKRRPARHKRPNA